MIERVKRCDPDSVADLLDAPLLDAPPESDPAAGFDETPKTIGRFQIVRELGRGGYGVVFLAVDPELDREVALKVPRPEAVLSADLRTRFLREGKAVASLNHANIIPVFEVGRVGALCYIASAYCDGISLAQWLRERGPAQPTQAARLVEVLAEAVQHAHGRGVVHRDLKPSNVLLDFRFSMDDVRLQTMSPFGSTSSGNAAIENQESTIDHAMPMITDFGLAKTAIHADQTRTGSILGTPSYMAPEQAAGRLSEVGPAADIYALGAILYELLTGQPPFRKESDLATLRAVEAEEPPPPRRRRPETPRDLEAICLKCLEKAPGQRYRTATELAADLQRFRGGQPVQARRIGTLERLDRWRRANPTLAALSGSVVVLLMTIAVGAPLASWSLQRRSADLEASLERTKAAERNERQAALAAQRSLYDALRAQMRAVSAAGMPGQRLHRLNAAVQQAACWACWSSDPRRNSPSAMTPSRPSRPSTPTSSGPGRSRLGPRSPSTPS